MSDQKLVSPLLDGFIMGDPISDHDGVRCCPAMKENSDDKYIVKIISVPASQKQLDALLLTGAFQDAAGATEYFKELADGIVKEAQLLQQLSKLEGFLPYDNWQIVPMDDNNLGYEVYLVGSYKRSLEKYLRRNTMTHLGAVNLGLDLCSALSICRRSGFMHVDLRPANIYLSGEREYRIGDLGFVKLSSLKYASLPSKYRSSYTPPELHNEMATLNPTADIYATGLILYQIYNNGQLPFEDHAPAEALPAPANADYEMAEIILKACHPNPRHRWQTPIEMGQALANYMQRNTVNDVPIVPPVAEPAMAESEPEEAAEAEAAESVEAQAAPENTEPSVETHEELAFMNDMISDETAPSTENGDDLSDAEMTDEVAAMLAQADELLQPEELTPVEPAVSDEDEDMDDDEDDEDEEEDDDELDERDRKFYTLIGLSKSKVALNDDDDEDEDDEDEEEEIAPVAVRPPKKKRRGWIAVVLILLLLAAAGGAGYHYYTNYYLLPIENMNISTVEDTITVNLTTSVDESLLTVVCTDTYGNTKSLPVKDGQVVFTELNSDTLYDITVEASGFHQTSKSNSGSCSTAKQTEIVDFTAKTGTEDGSVILNFTVNGPEKQDWLVEYTAEGEEAKSVSFTGHMVSITGLTLDKVYTFKLLPADEAEMWIVGTDTLEYNASKLVVAQNLEIVSCSDGVLTAQWNLPADTTVENWSVRCYSEGGYDETITVTETTAEFSGISAEDAYTVEVIASGMTQSARAYVTANPTTITDVKVTGSSSLNVSWTFSGNAPEGGWLLMYSVNGGKTSDVVKCIENSGTIDSNIPGAIYQISIQAADGSTVFGGEHQHTVAQAADFNEHSLSTDEIMVSLCATPDLEEWTHKDVESYPSTYASGTKVSLVLYATAKFYRPNEDTEMMFIIRDAQGGVLTELLSEKTVDWRSIWKDGYAYLDIPAMPTEAGEYTVDLYFGGQFVVRKAFTITE